MISISRRLTIVIFHRGINLGREKSDEKIEEIDTKCITNDMETLKKQQKNFILMQNGTGKSYPSTNLLS